MKRRDFIKTSSVLAGASFLWHCSHAFAFPENADSDFNSLEIALFETSDARYQAVYSHALRTLRANIVRLANYPKPVLIEGANYQGAWLECAPHEALVYAPIRADVARNNHLLFFALQREDGQMPCWVRKGAVGFAQIQMVVPIAATAWEVAQQNGDSELLEKAYNACSKWDQWLQKYRDTRQTRLCEGFCTYDTGHDNSPRWAGIPNRCPDGDARKCPPLPSLPRLSPDLSATVYGGRIALAAMANALGMTAEHDRWLADADAIRTAILTRLYSEEDAAFYDRDAQDQFVRIRGDVITRVLSEHVVDQNLFDTVYRHQIHNPSAFWVPYPFPSIALDDPAFVRPIPPNSWGGAAQALTALRAPRWMEHYGKPADLAHLMQRWLEAILKVDKFLQQMDPLNGSFTMGEADYSPAALVFFDFTWRLAGVRKQGKDLEWNVRPMPPDLRASYSWKLVPTRIAKLRYSAGVAYLRINNRDLCRTSSTVRLVSDEHGNLKHAIGIAEAPANVLLKLSSGREEKFTVRPNETVNIRRH